MKDMVWMTVAVSGADFPLGIGDKSGRVDNVRHASIGTIAKMNDT